MEFLNKNVLDTIEIIRKIITVGLFLYTMYFLVLGTFAMRPNPKYKSMDPKNRFAVIIAARNEGAVIGNLLDSLKRQNYPKELYDIIVIPNNCTDDTEKIARERGAQIFECKRPIKSKGEVLEEFFDHIMANRDKPENQYDAYCIFDADNLVDENFLKNMNEAKEGGANAAQGYRDSKNPYDTAMSSSYAIYYYAVNRFYNHARHHIGLSSLISGSGFMISHKLMHEMGGWKTQTLTEDIELTAKCVLMNRRVFWVPEAIIYDEQPLTFEQSWKQRRRWTTGLIQGVETYFWPLLKKTVKERNLKSFDIIMFLMALGNQIFYIISIILTMFVDYRLVRGGSVDYTYIIYRVLGAVLFSYIVCVIIATVAVIMAKKKPSKMIKGILFFWMFVFSWVPINIICLIKKETVWEQIDHTVSINIEEIPSDN
ncbi:MAG: glycosyltransferase family 2 protein [Proteocatella sp.]